MILIADPPFERLGLRQDSKRRVRFFAIADESAPSLIEFGILFVMAWWSGPARIAFNLLRDTLERVDPDEQLELAIADIDRSYDLFRHPSLARTPAGVGEIGWIARGRILKVSFGPVSEEIERFTGWMLWRGPTR